MAHSPQRPTVYWVGHGAGRDGAAGLEAWFRVRTFATVDELLGAGRAVFDGGSGGEACLVVEVDEQRSVDGGWWQRLRSIDPEPCVIVLSRTGRVADAVAAMRRGASAYLLQPCPRPVLVREIRRCFRKAPVRV